VLDDQPPAHVTLNASPEDIKAAVIEMLSGSPLN
jgi:hypothetical protein